MFSIPNKINFFNVVGVYTIYFVASVHKQKFLCCCMIKDMYIKSIFFRC